MKQILRPLRAYLRLPKAARAAHRLDRRGVLGRDPGPKRMIEEGLGWLCRAQDESPTRDGGVARHYSLISGWGASYPETTGYIIPTLLRAAAQRPELSERARRMLDWLVEIQLPDGGFQGGVVNAHPVVPVTFNTGQILIGLAAGARVFGEPYHGPMLRAAEWLRESQDPDGAWRRNPTPFAAGGEKTYETHVAWGLMEAERVAPGNGFGDAAMANVKWALTHQRENGWFANCCLTQPEQPLTHTIGYVLRGVVEGYRLSGEAMLLEAARRTADALLGAVRSDGALPGRLDSAWQPAVSWTCLTGNSQIALCWMILHEYRKDDRYLAAAFAANRFVRRTVSMDGHADTRGGVKGSFPVYGDYGRYEYLNWACKFTVDAAQCEVELELNRTRA